MEKKSIISANGIPLKRRICISIGLFLLRIYDRFRGCSGVKQETDRILDEYKKNEEVVGIVEEYIPKLKTQADDIINRNRYLENRVVFMFNELIVIDKLLDDGKYQEIKMLLSKYDLSKKLEY